MNTLPDMWRTEVWHPLSVHFPIALIFLAFVFKVLALRNEIRWQFPGSILLYLAVLTSWLAVYTGDLADGIVSRKLCDPTILKDHENAGILLSWVISGTALADLLYSFNLGGLRKKGIHILVVLALAVACGMTSYVGHLGASLVYQQGAGTYQPSADCSEFIP